MLLFFMHDTTINMFSGHVPWVGKYVIHLFSSNKTKKTLQILTDKETLQLIFWQTKCTYRWRANTCCSLFFIIKLLQQDRNFAWSCTLAEYMWSKKFWFFLFVCVTFFMFVCVAFFMFSCEYACFWANICFFYPCAKSNGKVLWWMWYDWRIDKHLYVISKIRLYLIDFIVSVAVYWRAWLKLFGFVYDRPVCSFWHNASY